MKNHIEFNKELADLIRGKYGNYSEIDPIELENGNFGLPVQVLKNKDLKEFRDIVLPFLKMENIKKEVIFKKVFVESQTTGKL